MGHGCLKLANVGNEAGIYTCFVTYIKGVSLHEENRPEIVEKPLRSLTSAHLLA